MSGPPPGQKIPFPMTRNGPVLNLSGPLAEQSSLDALSTGDGGPMQVGDDCTPRTLQSAVGLVWRAVILWMILLLMLTIAVWVA